MDEEDMPYRDPPKSEEFLISRTSLDEAYSALAGCLAVLGDTANISAGMEQLKTALGNHGDRYDGHNPQFVVAGWSEPMPGTEFQETAKLGLATNAELEEEMRVRREMGHTHPDYRTSGYDGPHA
jgi:hypothetical protein